jgi:hypothetical protein
MEVKVDKRRIFTSPFECVIDLHADKADLIRRLLVANSDFRQLCDDYRLVIEMIAEIDAAPTKALPDIHSEYLRLRNELETDIAHALERLASK